MTSNKEVLDEAITMINEQKTETTRYAKKRVESIANSLKESIVADNDEGIIVSIYVRKGTNMYSSGSCAYSFTKGILVNSDVLAMKDFVKDLDFDD